MFLFLQSHTLHAVILSSRVYSENTLKCNFDCDCDFESFYKKAILTGDININMLNQHESYAYRQVLQNYGFMVMNGKLTREESGKILDHLAINFNKIQQNNITFDTCIPTDHIGVLGSVGNNATSRIPSTTSVTKIDYERMPGCFLGLISGYYYITSDGEKHKAKERYIYGASLYSSSFGSDSQEE
jgi:hypothetical protein